MKWSTYALIALAIATAFLGVTLWRAEQARQTGQTQLAHARRQLDQLEANLRAARQGQADEHQRLLGLDSELGETKTQLTAAESRVVMLARDLAAAQAKPAAELEASKRELATLRGSWLPPDKIAAYEAKVADLQRELATRSAAAPAGATSTPVSPAIEQERLAWQKALASHDATEQALRTQIDSLTKDLANAQAADDRSIQLAAAAETIATLRRQLAQTPSPLSASADEKNSPRVAAATARGDALAQQLNDAQHALATASEQARASTAQIATLTRDLEAARAAVIPPATITHYQEMIAALEQQLAKIQGGRTLLPGGAAAAFTSAPRSPSVVNVGPQNAFVVLNIGSAHGAHQNQTLTICRGTEILAQVQISEVREHFSIAQVQPDSLRGTLQKGDTALIAN
ncbi:hypothetical protein K0B96_08065 [Horticoccus luteus]|uniref:Uncharacterized protein n=1 Tax=Horticoccus luteus TaxID=2862869 RepID=A0A8F9TWJ8_9BACT|nr:hypothetical protein [Horticoccus luteus]QYM80549.1 hypothetical protein K0B96_08065 [Horticoccus luteus]